MIKLKGVVFILVPLLLLTLSLISSLPIKVSAEHDQEYSEVDLACLASHVEDFLGMSVKTRGTVKFYISFYMYEDFWLQGQKCGAIPVVVRFAGLPTPPENSSIEVLGIIEYCELEGGFFYLNAREVTIIPESLLPEFPSFLILPVFMIATLLAVTAYRRKHST